MCEVRKLNFKRNTSPGRINVTDNTQKNKKMNVKCSIWDGTTGHKEMVHTEMITNELLNAKWSSGAQMNLSTNNQHNAPCCWPVDTSQSCYWNTKQCAKSPSILMQRKILHAEQPTMLDTVKMLAYQHHRTAVATVKILEIQNILPKLLGAKELIVDHWTMWQILKVCRSKK